MLLSEINYDFKLENQTFNNIIFSFGQYTRTSESGSDLISDAKKSLEILEQIADSKYNLTEFEKKSTGTISDRRIQIGYSYSGKNKTLLISSEINYTLYLNNSGVAVKQGAQFICIDKDANRVWNIYDNVLKIPNLVIDEIVNNQLKRLSMLRSGKFDIDKFLG